MNTDESEIKESSNNAPIKSLSGKICNSTYIHEIILLIS